MRNHSLLACAVLLATAAAAPAYVEAPYSLGQVINESTNAVLVEVTKVNKDKNLIVYKKVQDLKGKHPTTEIKHNIGKGGFHEREWKNIMAWAEVGKRAVFFHNNGASETCIGTYWYQCYPQGEWWGLSHAEPFLMRTYFGNPEKLSEYVLKMLEGKEVVVPCLADGDKNQLHLRKGKVQRLKASLKRGNYDAKRDFVGWGAGDDDADVEEFKSIVLLAQSTPLWRFLPAEKVVAEFGDKWREPDFNDKKWRSGKAPLGYGQDEIRKREGTFVREEGVPFVFRREMEVASDLLKAKGVVFHMGIASDDSADVYVNGELVDHDPVLDHDFVYWNRELDLPAKVLKPGRNVIAVYVRNHQGSHDIYLDMEIAAQIPLPKRVVARPAGGDPTKPGETVKGKDTPLSLPEKPGTMTVDKAKRTITIECAVAPRKLPNLAEIYPIEVIACFPAPIGQKAHETVVTFNGLRPSTVHKALLELGLKPGKPARGEDTRAEGPEVKLYLEFTDTAGRPKRLPLEDVLIQRDNGRPIPRLKWLFTGSVMLQPDPEKDEKVPGADLTGSLITVFPVTDEVLIQSNLTMKEEATMKLEIGPNVLPKEGTPLKLIIEAK
jgi:hypothetical protein